MAVVTRIRPKHVREKYEGQQYECIYDRSAPPELQWFWIVHFTSTTDIVGGAPTLAGAQRQARRKVREMLKNYGQSG